MTPIELMDLGRRLRAQVRGQLFEYIDGSLEIVATAVSGVNCPVCEKRRKTKAAAQKRWRKGKKQ